MPACRVLIVDDDEAVYTLLAASLGTDDDMEVEIAALARNAKEAYHLYLEARPDLVVIDLVLPGEGGLDIAAQLLEFEPCVPVIVFSAHVDEAVRARAERLGVLACISKDRVEELSIIVRERCAAV